MATGGSKNPKTDGNFVIALNKAHVLALNTAHVLRLNKADVLALNKAHVLRLNTKICPAFNTRQALAQGPGHLWPCIGHVRTYFLALY